MKDETEDQTEGLIKIERRGIWLCLIVVFALTAMLVASEMRRGGLPMVSPLFVILIVLGAAWVNRGSRDASTNASLERRELVTHDELRLAAVSRAYKWAFFLMLGGLTIFCFLSATAGVTLPAQTVAALAIATGVIAFLACFLLFDRA